MESPYLSSGLSPVWKTEPESPLPPSWGVEPLEDVELWGGKEEPWKEEPWKDEAWAEWGSVSSSLSPEETLSNGDEILEDLEGIIKKESFNTWVEGGLYENNYNISWDFYKGFTSPAAVPVQQSQLIPDQTDLLREFEDVLTQTTESLTPPESPKVEQQALINILQEINAPAVNEIDQLVATEAEKQNGVASSSVSTTSGEPWSSPSPSQSDSGYDDPDWSPNDWSSDQTSYPSENKRSSRKTTTEERKLRKKEQNKNAATRYRQKKKQEMEGIMGEEKGLQDENDRLKTDITEITREIRYLKSLMRDLFKAKGLIS